MATAIEPDDCEEITNQRVRQFIRMNDKENPSQCMEELKRRIDQAGDILRLRIVLQKDHQPIVDRLSKCCALLEQQPEDQTAKLEAKVHHGDSCEKTFLWWIN